tara:strand:+ start:173 stop:694 length:522 start_codon:yes stop_codon:yes gene_type:complete
MAIDNMQGKVSTTGMMNQKPKTPKAPNLKGLGKAQPMPEPKKPTPAQVGTTNPLQKEFPEATETELMFAERAKSLTDEDQAALQTVLSPSVKNALGKIIPEFKPVMDAYGTNEPNVVIPMSLMSNYAMKIYGNNNPEEAIARFYDDVTSDIDRQMDQNNVPPSQGLMTSPQTT